MTPLEIITATLLSEDRGGGAAGMEPIGGVILNRFEWPRVNGKPFWWSDPTGDLVGHCIHKGQFDGWNWGDPSFRLIITGEWPSDAATQAACAAAADIAQRMIATPDKVNRANGATHYFARTELSNPPAFYFSNPKTRTGVRTPCFETAHHLFFKIGPGA